MAFIFRDILGAVRHEAQRHYHYLWCRSEVQKSDGYSKSHIPVKMDVEKDAEGRGGFGAAQCIGIVVSVIMGGRVYLAGRILRFAFIRRSSG